MQNIDQIGLVTRKITFDQNSLPVLAQALRIAIYDEYKAFEFYKAVVAKYSSNPPFTNLIQAETRHFEALIALCKKYEIKAPVNDLQGSIIAPESLKECYELGVASEIENIYMYDYLLPFVGDYTDVVDTFYRLQAASFNNHLPILRSHVENANQENVMEKFNEFSQMATKIASGDAKPEELTQMLSQSNISLITGLLTGGVGGIALNQFFTDMKEEK